MFKDKVVIITGGSAGTGFETARLFLNEKAKVVITGRNREKLDKARSLLEETGQVLALKADVSKEEDVALTIEKTVEKFGTLDVLVNNAGIAMVKKMSQTTLDEWNEMFAVHSTGTFLMSREAVRYWGKNKIRGKIVNVSSVSGKAGSAMATAYSAAKAAVLGFTRALAKEVAPWGILVNAVCPGAIDTEMFQEGTIGVIADMFKQDRQKIMDSTLSVIPLKRLLDPSEVGEMILYLASPKADGITGQSFTISCGYDIH